MRTLNGEQARKDLEFHICPLQFDIVERIIERFSNPGELVLDPFGGLMTVPYMAVKLGRRGYGVELNAQSWKDGIAYLKMAEDEVEAPSLFDFDEVMERSYNDEPTENLSHNDRRPCSVCGSVTCGMECEHDEAGPGRSGSIDDGESIGEAFDRTYSKLDAALSD
jgi:hypothetical protein